MTTNIIPLAKALAVDTDFTQRIASMAPKADQERAVAFLMGLRTKSGEKGDTKDSEPSSLAAFCADRLFSRDVVKLILSFAPHSPSERQREALAWMEAIERGIPPRPDSLARWSQVCCVDAPGDFDWSQQTLGTSTMSMMRACSTPNKADVAAVLGYFPAFVAACHRDGVVGASDLMILMAGTVTKHSKDADQAVQLAALRTAGAIAQITGSSASFFLDVLCESLSLVREPVRGVARDALCEVLRRWGEHRRWQRSTRDAAAAAAASTGDAKADAEVGGAGAAAAAAAAAKIALPLEPFKLAPSYIRDRLSGYRQNKELLEVLSAIQAMTKEMGEQLDVRDDGKD